MGTPFPCVLAAFPQLERRTTEVTPCSYQRVLGSVYELLEYICGNAVINLDSSSPQRVKTPQKTTFSYRIIFAA